MYNGWQYITMLLWYSNMTLECSHIYQFAKLVLICYWHYYDSNLHKKIQTYFYIIKLCAFLLYFISSGRDLQHIKIELHLEISFSLTFI